MDQRLWEEHLWAAEEAGQIDKHTHYVALRMAHLIRWAAEPRLQWSGPSLWEALRVSKSAFYRHLDLLVERGLLRREPTGFVPTGGTPVPLGGKVFPMGGTNRPVDGTISKQVVSKQRATVLSAETTSEAIEQAFLHEETVSQYFAAVFTVKSLRRWPEAVRPRFTLLIRLFDRLRSEHGDAAVWACIANWFAETADLDAQNPGGLFAAQCDALITSTIPTEAAHGVA